NGDQSDNSVPNNGAVYIFRRSGASWKQEAYIKPPVASENSNFGWRLALWGDTLAVHQAIRVGNNTVNTVYVFKRAGCAWSLSKTINGVYGPNLSRDWMVVAVDGGYQAYKRSGDDWLKGPTLTRPHGIFAISGDTVVFGAPSENNNTGKAYVF